MVPADPWVPPVEYHRIDRRAEGLGNGFEIIGENGSAWH